MKTDLPQHPAGLAAARGLAAHQQIAEEADWTAAKRWWILAVVGQVFSEPLRLVTAVHSEKTGSVSYRSR